ncbi:MAG TPA: hypothetical protein PKU70_11025 [Vicinamibacteria bacterium]|nr:hypothetical protein [Vicinamibacteria bacterium]
MPALETLSLASLAVGAAAILRFVWLDSLRFADQGPDAADPVQVSARTAQRLALQAEADRVLAETESLPRAA